LATIREWTPKLARALRVVGLINIQYAVQDNQVYIIEANPRASRTVPFVAKAIGHPLAAYASLLMSGKKLPELGFTEVGQAACWLVVGTDDRAMGGGGGGARARRGCA
jgi:carbamoyl-phosphate synthase large subunit